MPLGQWSGHIWGKDPLPGHTATALTALTALESRSPTPQISWRACTPSTPPSRLDTRSPAIPSRNGFQSRCSTRCTTRASSRLSNRGKVSSEKRSVKTPSFETPRSLSPKSDSDDEDRLLAKQAHTIRKWSSSTQVTDSYAELCPFTESLMEDSEPLFEPDSKTDEQLLVIYQASLELTEMGISTVMAPTVARRFKTALEAVAANDGLDGSEVFEPFHEDLFKEAMEAYVIYGRMESIVCEMEILIERVLNVLNDDGDHGFDILTGKAIGVGLAPDADEQKTKIIMQRVFELLAALTAEAKSFNYMAWLTAIGESDLEVTELIEEFIQQKQEVRKHLWMSKIEADELLTNRLLTAAVTFAKWFEKLRKAADEFCDFILKQYQESGHYGYYKAKKAFQKQAEERKRWAQRLQETKEVCKHEVHECHGRRVEATIEMRREREAAKEEDFPVVSGLPVSERARKSRMQNKLPTVGPSVTGRRFSWSSKRSSHMEEQIMALLGHAREHLDELQLLAQEQRVREQKAFELLLRMLMKSRVLERRRLRKATTQNISQRVSSLMPGRFVVMHKTKPVSELEDFSVTSSLLQQQVVCKELNELTVAVELKDIWTGVEGKFLMKKKAKAKKRDRQVKKQSLQAAAKSNVGNLWSKARDSVAAGSAVSAILGIQATKEAEAAAAHEAQVRAEAEAYAAEAEAENDEEEDDEDLFNFPPHFSLVDVQLLLSDAAVTRTEKLRELRQEVSQVVQQIGATYGREAWEYNAQALQAHSNYNPWAALMPVVEKEMMSLGESGRFFLSRQDSANLQDLMRQMRGIKSQLAVETANRSHFEDDEDRWTFGSEHHIRSLIEQLRQLHQTLSDRKQKAAKLDIRAELTQELAHLHPELRTTYGLVQKHKPPAAVVEEKKEEEEEEEQDDRLDSFKTFLFALKFKHKMSESQNATKLRETKVQLQGTIANAQKMMGEDFGATKNLEEEKELAQTQVHYIRRLHMRIQMNETANYQLKQLRSEKALAKSRLKASAQAAGAGAAGAAAAAAAAAGAAGDATAENGDGAAGDATGDTAPKGKAARASAAGGRSGRKGTAGGSRPKQSSTTKDDRTQSSTPSSWLARASHALSAPVEMAEKSHSPRQSTPQSSAAPGRSTVFFVEEDRPSQSSQTSEDSSTGVFVRPSLLKRATVDERRAQFNRLFTSTMQRRLRTATDKGAALIFRKSLVDASKAQQITTRILDSKRVDLQNLLRLTLQRFGIKTTQRIQSAKEQRARWDGEVAYLNEKLNRGQGMASFWQDRYDGWLSDMGAVFGESVYDAFVHSDRQSDRDVWSQRLQEALHDAFDSMREETPSLAVDVSHHIEVPEDAVSNARTGTSTLRLGDVHMAKLMQRGEAPVDDEASAQAREAVQAPAEVLQHNLPEPPLRQPAIPARPMRHPGVSSTTLRLPKMPIILQPEEGMQLEPPGASVALASKKLPAWLTSQGRLKEAEQVPKAPVAPVPKASFEESPLELESKEVSELESKHINLARRRTVQPWVESVEWIEDISYRTALKTLQRQFHRGKTQEEEAWGIQLDAAHHPRRPRKKKVVQTRTSTLDQLEERNNVLRRENHWIAMSSLQAAELPHQWAASRPSHSLRRGKPRARVRNFSGMDCVVGNRGVRFRGRFPERLLFQEPSTVATSATEATEDDIEDDGPRDMALGAPSALRRLRRFRRRMLKRFCGAEEAYQAVVTTPIGELDYEAFCQLAAQIGFNFLHTRMVWHKIQEFLEPKLEAAETASETRVTPRGDTDTALKKTDFAHAMSFACSVRDLVTLRIRLQLRYGSLTASFDHMEQRHLDQESWTQLCWTVGASAEEAKNFFKVMMANSLSHRSPSKISRRNFLLVLRNAEGFAVSRSLFQALKLSNEATAWRTLMEYARRTAKHKGIQPSDARSITSNELQQLLTPLCSPMQCEALLRMAMAKRQQQRVSGPVRLEEVLLVAVAGLGLRAHELRAELGQDYEGEASVATTLALRRPETAAPSSAPAPRRGGTVQRLRQSMALSLAEATRKLQRGEEHQGVTTLMGIVGKRPPSQVRSVRSGNESSDTEDLRSISSPASRASRSPTRSSPRVLE